MTSFGSEGEAFEAAGGGGDPTPASGAGDALNSEEFSNCEYDGRASATSSSAAEEAASPAENESVLAECESTSGGEHDEQTEGAGTGETSEEELLDPLSEAMKTISSLEEKLARANADIYNLQQEYNGFVRRSKAEGAVRREEGITSVIEALLPVLDDAALARQHGDLDGPAGQIVDKVEQTLAVNYKVERFGAEGDEFDPQIHEALMHQTSADVDLEKVNVLIQPGYKIGEKLLRPARVGVVSPE